MIEFFKEIGKTITDFKFYNRVKGFRLSKAMRYIFSLILLITLVLTIRYSYDFKKGLNVALDWAKKNLPPIEIQNGIVNVNVQQPYKVTEEGLALIIDTTGQINSLDEYGKGILLTKDKIIYKESEIKTETYKLSNIQSLRIDENFMNALRKNALWILSPLMFVFTYVGFCFARFIQILLFSIFSLATSSIVNAKLSYKQLFNIGIYAITPSVILGALLALLGIQLPLFWILYSGLYIIYLIISIINCKEEVAKEDVAFPDITDYK